MKTKTFVVVYIKIAHTLLIHIFVWNDVCRTLRWHDVKPILIHMHASLSAVTTKNVSLAFKKFHLTLQIVLVVRYSTYNGVLIAVQRITQKAHKLFFLQKPQKFRFIF